VLLKVSLQTLHELEQKKDAAWELAKTIPELPHWPIWRSPGTLLKIYTLRKRIKIAGRHGPTPWGFEKAKAGF
jgi:hypothetical protein